MHRRYPEQLEWYWLAKACSQRRIFRSTMAFDISLVNTIRSILLQVTRCVSLLPFVQCHDDAPAVAILIENVLGWNMHRAKKFSRRTILCISNWPNDSQWKWRINAIELHPFTIDATVSHHFRASNKSIQIRNSWSEHCSTLICLVTKFFRFISNSFSIVRQPSTVYTCKCRWRYVMRWSQQKTNKKHNSRNEDLNSHILSNRQIECRFNRFCIHRCGVFHSESNCRVNDSIGIRTHAHSCDARELTSHLSWLLLLLLPLSHKQRHDFPCDSVPTIKNDRKRDAKIETPSKPSMGSKAKMLMAGAMANMNRHHNKDVATQTHKSYRMSS